MGNRAPTKGNYPLGFRMKGCLPPGIFFKGYLTSLKDTTYIFFEIYIHGLAKEGNAQKVVFDKIL